MLMISFHSDLHVECDGPRSPRYVHPDIPSTNLHIEVSDAGSCSQPRSGCASAGLLSEEAKWVLEEQRCEGVER